jgi:hypothetical protein
VSVGESGGESGKSASKDVRWKEDEGEKGERAKGDEGGGAGERGGESCCGEV